MDSGHVKTESDIMCHSDWVTVKLYILAFWVLRCGRIMKYCLVPFCRLTG